MGMFTDAAKQHEIASRLPPGYRNPDPYVVLSNDGSGLPVVTKEFTEINHAVMYCRDEAKKNPTLVYKIYKPVYEIKSEASYRAIERSIDLTPNQS